MVSLRYTLTDDAGTLLDSSGPEPLTYLHGFDSVLPALERALEGNEVGFKSKVTVPPSEGYGEHDPESIFEAPRDHFPPGARIAPGMEVTAQGPEGPVTLKVLELTDGGALLDANHALAGKTLHFELEIVGLREATQEELDHGHVHEGGHSHPHGS